MNFARNFALLAVIALALTLLPGGGAGLALILTILSIGFFAAIAVLSIRMYREHRFALDAMPDRLRLVLYGSGALALFTLTASRRLFEAGGLGLLLWLALLALASFGIFWVFQKSREYD